MSNDLIIDKLILGAGEPELGGKCLIVGGTLCIPLGHAGNNTSDATALAGDILQGKIAYVASGKVTGTIQSLPAATITPGSIDQVIASGRYLSGDQTILGDVNLAPENIRSGIYIFGILGTYAGGEEEKERVIDWVVSPVTISAAGAMSGFITQGDFGTPDMEIAQDLDCSWDEESIVSKDLNHPLN